MNIIERLVDAVRIRPHRLVEIVVALLALGAAFGLNFTPEQSAAIIGVIVAFVGGSEAAQTQTTPLAAPRSKNGEPLWPFVANGAEHRERGAD